MPSSKGEPTDPQLREKLKNKIQEESGGGWAAWKAAKLAKEYEAAGGGYKDTGDNENKPKKGTPEPKAGNEGNNAGGAAQTQKREKREREGKETNQTDDKKNKEEKAASNKKAKTSSNGDVKKQQQKKDDGETKEDKKEEKEEPKAKKASGGGAAANGEAKTKKAKAPAKEPTKGTRSQPSRASKK